MDPKQLNRTQMEEHTNLTSEPYFNDQTSNFHLCVIETFT
jgi:hypothetical protein